MRVSRETKSADRISHFAILSAGSVCGILVFVVALPLALSNPFPTPKHSEYVLETSAVNASAAPPSPLVPSPMESVDAGAAAGDESGLPSVARGAKEAKAPPSIEVPPEATRMKPDERVAETPKRRAVSIMQKVDRYLWDVYQRLTTKSDSSGDFTWKDPAAAKHRGVSLQEYVIGGMDPDFREQLYHAGQAMDASGIHWSMLSAFRDDYRQALASGFKAHGGNSQHGGSNATGGYGHGRAIDLTTASGDASAAWRWVDSHGAKFGLRRPMPGYDPAHIQAGPTYHQLAAQLREARIRLGSQLSGLESEGAAKGTKVASQQTRSGN
jgi:hypothetical protein